MQSFLNDCSEAAIAKVELDSDGPSAMHLRTNRRAHITSPNRERMARLVDIVAGEGTAQRLQSIQAVQGALPIQGIWSGIRYGAARSGEGLRLVFSTSSTVPQVQTR